MDADVMITLAFGLEVVLFGLAAAVLISREARKGRAEAAPASANASACKAGPPFDRPCAPCSRGMRS
jgi:hypothetical protein